MTACQQCRVCPSNGACTVTPSPVFIVNMGQLFSGADGRNWQPNAAVDQATSMVDMIAIPQAQLKGGAEGKHTVYIISVQLRGQDMSHQVYRRYNLFKLLHSKLQAVAEAEGLSLPPLPGRKLFGSNNAAFVEKRRVELELYLQNLLRTPLATSADLISFLGVTANMIDSEANSNGMHGFGFDWTVRTGGAGNTLFSPASKKDKLSQSG